MASTRALRVLAAAAVGGLLAIAAITPGSAATPRTRTTTEGGTVHGSPAGHKTPPPPQLPANFRGKGRYIVRDLGIEVPFTWEGRNGDSQMIAGGPNYPIWFTNLIVGNTLYTLTYKWPNLPPPQPCSAIQGFSRQTLNDVLKTSRFVGPEILQGKPDRHVNHWRVGVVAGSTEPGQQPRLPIALGDVYVDQGNPTQWWQVLQFGLQNLFDPALDEWIKMTTWSRKPGQVNLPAECAQPSVLSSPVASLAG